MRIIDWSSDVCSSDLLALSLIAANITGHGFSALGFLPALLALTLYSMLPVVRNIVTGIVNLDPALIEAAHGVGMTVRQRLLRVELPLVAPVAMAEIGRASCRERVCQYV